MSTGNPNYNVGGTAKDGGVSTADTVRDGGSDGNRAGDETYVPGSGASGGSGTQTRGKTYDMDAKCENKTLLIITIAMATQRPMKPTSATLTETLAVQREYLPLCLIHTGRFMAARSVLKADVHF